MKNDMYKSKFKNTLEHVGFHDCTIKQIEWENDKLFLYFDWLYFLPTHPIYNNGAGNETDDALICFENVKVLKSEWHDHSKAAANALERRNINGDTSPDLTPYIDFSEIEINDIDFSDALKGLFILSLDIVKNDEIYICQLKGDGVASQQYGINIEFEYSNAYLYFSNLFTS